MTSPASQQATRGAALAQLIRRPPVSTRVGDLRNLAIVALELAGLTAVETSALRVQDLQLLGSGRVRVTVAHGRRQSAVDLDEWQSRAVLRYVEAGRLYRGEGKLWLTQRGAMTARAVLWVLRRLAEKSGGPA